MRQGLVRSPAVRACPPNGPELRAVTPTARSTLEPPHAVHPSDASIVGSLHKPATTTNNTTAKRQQVERTKSQHPAKQQRQAHKTEHHPLLKASPSARAANYRARRCSRKRTDQTREASRSSASFANINARGDRKASPKALATSKLARPSKARQPRMAPLR